MTKQIRQLVVDRVDAEAKKMCNDYVEHLEVYKSYYTKFSEVMHRFSICLERQDKRFNGFIELVSGSDFEDTDENKEIHIQISYNGRKVESEISDRLPMTFLAKKEMSIDFLCCCDEVDLLPDVAE